MHNAKRRLFRLLMIASAFWVAGTCFGQQLGELRIEGKYIERLVLRRKNGHTERFEQPGKTVRLPVGQYRFREARLKGGYSSRFLSRDWVIVSKDEAAVLKVGAPLKQTIRAKRQGNILVLDYRLTGLGGEQYTGGDRSRPPTFTVYKGKKEITSGKFEFG